MASRTLKFIVLAIIAVILGAFSASIAFWPSGAGEWRLIDRNGDGKVTEDEIPRHMRHIMRRY